MKFQVARDLTPEQISMIKTEIYSTLHFMFCQTLPETENINLNPHFWANYISNMSETLLINARKGEL